MVGASMVSRTAAFPVASPVGLVSIGHEHHLGRGVRRAARRPEAARLRRDRSHVAVLQPASRHLRSEGARTREDAMADRQDDGSSSTTDASVARVSTRKAEVLVVVSMPQGRQKPSRKSTSRGIIAERWLKKRSYKEGSQFTKVRDEK
jgi:hypothetical protein